MTPVILNFRPASLFVYTHPPAPFPFQFSDDTGHGWPTTTVEPHLTDRDRSKLESAVSGGKRRVDCLGPSVYAASSLDVCGPRRGGEGTEIVDSIVGKFDRITADDGFHGREGGREEDEDISRANSRDLWRPRTVHAPLNIDFSISPIYSTPRQISRIGGGTRSPRICPDYHTRPPIFFKLIP